MPLPLSSQKKNKQVKIKTPLLFWVLSLCFSFLTCKQSKTSNSSGFIIGFQFSSVAQSCPTLCHPMGCSTPGLPVHHQLPVFTQTHVHSAGDAIEASHLLSSPSPPIFNVSQQGSFKMSQFFTSGDQSIGVSASGSVPLMNIQDWFPLGWTG